MSFRKILPSSLAFISLLSAPIWSAEAVSSESASAKAATSQKIVEEGKISEIAGYATYLQCDYFENLSPFTSSQFNIHRSSDLKKIGEILLQYYPEGGYYKTAGQTPTLRLRHIEIEEAYRRNHHATRALETLFRQLRASPLLPKNAEIWLEYSTCYPHLTKLYADFGFEGTREPSFVETKVLHVNLFKTKFPYYKKMLAMIPDVPEGKR